MEQEARTTRKMLERIPDDKHDWQPHPKSMQMRQLATHIAELPSWVTLVLNTDGLDFAQAPYEPKSVTSTADILAMQEESLASGKASLRTATEDQLNPIWTLHTGDTIHSQTSRGEFIRVTYSQIVHHRAQLGVYLRLLDIPIPGSYGPSADEPTF